MIIFKKFIYFFQIQFLYNKLSPYTCRKKMINMWDFQTSPSKLFVLLSFKENFIFTILSITFFYYLWISLSMYFKNIDRHTLLMSSIRLSCLVENCNYRLAFVQEIIEKNNYSTHTFHQSECPNSRRPI